MTLLTSYTYVCQTLSHGQNEPFNAVFFVSLYSEYILTCQESCLPSFSGIHLPYKKRVRCRGRKQTLRGARPQPRLNRCAAKRFPAITAAAKLLLDVYFPKSHFRREDGFSFFLRTHGKPSLYSEVMITKVFVFQKPTSRIL